MSIPVALVWHQHQPYYKDTSTGEMALPWVRLHGIKDYYGMAKLVEEFPGMRCTINLVPSMLTQLLDYVENKGTDPFLRRTQMPASSMTSGDVEFVLDHFFMAQWDRMIRVHPRYRELLEMRRFGRRGARAAAQDFTEQDVRDLQVWFTLAWFHPVCFDEYEVLRTLRAKGKGFTDAEKDALLAVEQEVLGRVIPLHRKLLESGQLELTTTPFYHPILPLLCDMRSANAAMPRTPMPRGYQALVEDAEAHVKKAMDFHKRILGESPAGMWPAEGSVSPQILPLLAKQGVQWIATDEEILSASLGTGLRGGFGTLDRPDLLYRPWKLEYEGGSMNAVFRDHALSDLVGFQYQNWDGEAAATAFLTRLEAASRGRPCGDETLVTVILDGENCWEHYPEQGVGFLRQLYRRLQDGEKGLTPTRVKDFIQAHPPSKSIAPGKLFPGSWINHDFYIWIGHTEDRKGWEYVFSTREDLVAETKRRGVNPLDFSHGHGTPLPTEDPALVHAWESLYIAEGSDWFWWFGDDHSSGNDEAFDRLFRQHLKNVYTYLKLPAPAYLDQPVMGARGKSSFTLPHSVLEPVLDGRVTSYFEWLGSGEYRPDKEGGVMEAAAPPLCHQINFGYDRDHLFVRVNFQEEPRGAQDGARVKRVRLLFADPKDAMLEIERGPPLKLSHQGAWISAKQATEVAWDEILEAKLSFASLGLERSKEISFFVQLEDSDGRTERYPRNCALSFAVPPEDVEERDWMA